MLVDIYVVVQVRPRARLTTVLSSSNGYILSDHPIESRSGGIVGYTRIQVVAIGELGKMYSFNHGTLLPSRYKTKCSFNL